MPNTASETNDYLSVLHRGVVVSFRSIGAAGIRLAARMV